MAIISITQACDIVIVGTKVDLARRKLLPSLYQLEKAGALDLETSIIGVGRAWNIKVYIYACSVGNLHEGIYGRYIMTDM